MSELTDLKPSEMIRVALGHLKECEEDPNYTIHMGVWHSPLKFPEDEKKTCHVCLAGAVIAKGLKSDKDSLIDPTHFNTDIENILYALNRFREGLVYSGLASLGKYHPYDYKHIDSRQRYIASYDVCPSAFHHDMYRLADYLESEGF